MTRKLAELPPRLQAAFAAACAERLFPAYVDFWKRAGRGDQVALAATLERIWKNLLGDGAMGTGDIRAEPSRTMELIPGESDEPWVSEQPYGEDAASAVAYTLRALDSGAPQEAAWSARRAYEAVDHHVMHRLGIADDERVLSHPLVQAELARQQRDLGELRAATQELEVIDRLRYRARAEAPLVFWGKPGHA